nr:DUF2383 domain-containing protein [Rhodoblastus sphagnicola]
MKILHTSEIDARDGYEAANEHAEDDKLIPVFTDMIGLHELNAQEIAAVLTGFGEKASPDGSFMGAVHRAIVNVRALFQGLDDGVPPGLIEEERRNVEKFNAALKIATFPIPIEALLTAQRDRLQQKIAELETRVSASLHA